MPVRNLTADNGVGQLSGVRSKIDFAGGSDLVVKDDVGVDVARGFRCKSISGGAGVIAFVDEAGVDQTTEIMPGEVLVYYCIRVKAAGTTATGIEVLF